VLQRLETEVSKPEILLNRSEDNRRNELATLAKDCRRVVSVLSQILEKYNALSEEKRSVTKLWQRVRFGNGEMLDLEKIRSELATYTQAMTLFLNLFSIGSQWKVEAYMNSHGEELREIKHSFHWVTASMQASSHEEKSILTSYAEDDKAVWKAFRRELIKEGVSSRLLEKHKKTIKRYVMELGERGVLDELVQEEMEMEMEMEMENCDISTIQHSNPDLGEGPNTEATHRTEAPSISSTDAEDVLHLDDLDQATMEIRVDTNFVSNSESFAGEPSSTNSSTIVLSDVANNGKTSEPEALCGSSPSLPSDGRVYSKDSRRKKDGCRYGGTESWVQDHSDAPPSPDAAPLVDRDPADDTIADDTERRNMRSTCPGRLPVKSENPVNEAQVGPLLPELYPKHPLAELASSSSIPTSQSRARYQAYVEDVMDEDFAVGAHPN
jgi:hypothetical protein